MGFFLNIFLIIIKVIKIIKIENLFIELLKGYFCFCMISIVELYLV